MKSEGNERRGMPRRVSTRVLAAAFAVLLFGVVSPLSMNSASAQSQTQQTQPSQSSESKLSVAPAIIENTVDPGVTFATQVMVTNGTVRPTAFHSSLEGLQMDQTVDPAHMSSYDVSSWLKLDESDFLLMGNEAQTVNLTISVPQNAEPGGHYATVYFEAFVPEQANAGNATVVNGRVGVVVLLSVRGEINPHALSPDGMQTPGWQKEAGPTELGFDLHNDGNIHLEPVGSVVVKDVFGREVKELKLVGGRYEGAGPTLLPGVQRPYEVVWEHGPRFGVFKADAKVQFDPNTAPLVIDGKYFVLFPMIIAVPIAVLVGLILLTLGIRRFRRKRRERAKVEIDESSTD